jgi:hypothetical protein
MSNAATKEKKIWRLTFTVEVYADNEDEATKIARSIYEDAAKPLSELEGVRWLLPVADVAPRWSPPEDEDV